MPAPIQASDSDHQPTWHPLHALAGWLVPGLGHVLLGQRTRGLVLGVTILSLWLGGLLVGGISSIDRGRHPAWFWGQMLIAPSCLADLLRGELEARRPRLAPDAHPLYTPGYGRVGEQGVLFTTLAGGLNLLTLLDVAYCDALRRRQGRRQEQGAATEGAAS